MSTRACVQSNKQQLLLIKSSEHQHLELCMVQKNVVGYVGSKTTMTLLGIVILRLNYRRALVINKSSH
jgi:hypothetical protein